MNHSRINNNRFDNYLIVLILSLGLGSIGFPFVLSRILSILFLPNLFVLIRRCEYTRGLIKFFIFFTGFCLCSLAWSFNFTEGCKSIVYNCVHFALFFEVIVFARYANKPLSSVSKGWTLVVFILSVIAVWEILTGNHLPVAREADQSINLGGIISQRIIATATFMNYNTFVTFLCFALPWIFYRMSIIFSEKFNFLITILALLLSILIILIDGSRGGLFAIVVMLGVYIFFMPKGKISIITSFLFIGVLLFVMLKYGEQIFLVLSMKNEAQGLTSDSSRIEIWTVCANAFFNSFGLGSGIGGISGAIESVSKNVIGVPHNMIVEAFLEYGFVVGVLFIIFIWNLLNRGYKLLDKKRRMSVLMSILSMPIFSIINSVYLKSPETFVLFATIYVFVNYERIKFDCK